MKRNINGLFFTLLTVITISGCSEKKYALGDLTAPTDLVISTEVIGKDATHPNGDGSGNVKITVSAKNAISYKVDFDANDAENLVQLPKGVITNKYLKAGVNTFRITFIAYGKGGTPSAPITQDVTVWSNFQPSADIITNLTGGTSKTWVVDKSVAGHFGVGPWDGSSTPQWWAAGPNEKAGCCNCFYSATFTFTKAADNTYSLQVSTPEGAFTKTGDQTTLPGIPPAGDEGCYNYAGGTSSFSFIPRSNTTVPEASSTKTSILLAGNNTFIGYGALQKEYEIVSLSATSMYLRVQGTETGNAWYLKLVPKP